VQGPEFKPPYHQKQKQKMFQQRIINFTEFIPKWTNEKRLQSLGVAKVQERKFMEESLLADSSGAAVSELVSGHCEEEFTFCFKGRKRGGM
jgi:hypothetical protein